MDVIKLVNDLNADNKVWKVVVKFDGSHSWNNKIIEKMMKKYSNVCIVSVVDHNNSIDSMHKLVQKWIKQ